MKKPQPELYRKQDGQFVISRYGDNLPPIITNQKFNEALKKVAEIAGINEHVHKGITKAGKRISTRYQKFEIVFTHTARRSFATNLYKAGLPTLTIMAITGHKTEASFLKYIKVTPREHAEKLRDFWNKNREHLKVV